MTQVRTSRFLQTNATVLRVPGAGTLVVDAPYFPDELEELRRSAGDDVRLFATHSHYDHVMGRLALPAAPLLAGPETVAAIRRDPLGPARDLEHADARMYVRRDRELLVDDIEPVEQLAGLRLIPADGHAGDGRALLWAAGGVLCCGDFLSDVEIPLLSWAGSLPAYQATLDRLEAALREDRPRVVVPGHGAPTDAAGALERLAEDRAYLDDLPRADPDQPLPPGRDSGRQREIHRANLERHG